jgi:hypothetical protein
MSAPEWSVYCWAPVAAAVMSGFLAGCVQLPAPQYAPYDPERQAHVDSFCAGAGSILGVEQCRQYYIGDPRRCLMSQCEWSLAHQLLTLPHPRTIPGQHR